MCFKDHRSPFIIEVARDVDELFFTLMMLVISQLHQLNFVATFSLATLKNNSLWEKLYFYADMSDKDHH